MSYPPPSPPPGGGYPGAPQGGSGGYGAPPPPPGGGYGSPQPSPGSGGYGAPQQPEKKSRTPMFIAIACAVLFVGAIVLGGGGFGAYLLLSGSDAEETTQTDPTDDGPTDEPTDDPSDEPTDEPTTDEPTTDEPTTDEPSVDPTDSDLFTLTTGSPIALEQLELDDGTVMTPDSGLYQGVYITLTNHHDEDIGLQYSNFFFYDTEGNVVELAYAGATHNDGIIPPGETAEASLVADVPSDVTLESVVYRDIVATGFEEAVYPI
jgi:hypothetical protein